MSLGACAPGMFNLPGEDTVPRLIDSDQKMSGDVPTFALRYIPYAKVPGWGADDLRAFLPVFLKSCEKISGKAPDRNMGPDKAFGTVAQWMALCDQAAQHRGQSHNALRYFFEKNFKPYLVFDKGDPVGLFTGYYEAELQGSWSPGGMYNVPIYGPPKDIISVDLGKFRAELAGTVVAGRVEGKKFVPFYNRAEIAAGALNGRQLELMWVNSSIDAFFLHIQGSGKVVMEDGSSVRVGYAGRNGARYVAVGRELIAANTISHEDMSMQAIRAWMEANPVAALTLMNVNQSFIFFRMLDEPNPVGAQGVPLSAGYSLAIDDDFIPYGMPIWLNITDPRDPDHKIPLRRLVVSQDTGSAIKGPVRGDLFWGGGREAAAAAGVMKEHGMYYLLLPRAAAVEGIDTT